MNLGKCPNDGNLLVYYDGALGYEGARCMKCGYEYDLNLEANAQAHGRIALMLIERKAARQLPAPTRPPERKFYARNSEPVPFPKDAEAERLNFVRCPNHHGGGATHCPRGGAALQIWQRQQWGDR